MTTTSHGFIGDLLIRAGVVDAAGLARGLEVATQNATTLSRALAGLGLASEADVASAVASAMHLEFLDGDVPVVVPELVALLPEAFCRQRGVLALGYDRDVLRVAVVNPMDDSAVRDTAFRVGRKTVAVVVTEAWFQNLFAQVYPEAARAASYDMLQDVHPTGQVEAQDEYELVDPATLAKDVRLPPIVKLVNLILSDAAKAGASDVHIEPHEAALQVRVRVDGLLRDVLTVPHHLQDATISRIKIISGMDIAERRKPQDGRSRLRFEGRRIDLRVSTMPTQFGEKIVIRLLNPDQKLASIDDLALSPDNLRLLKGFLANAQGMVLVTGPTGSGKTSTLYSALAAIQTTANNIVTLEDPIEMQIPGVNQMQINARAGVTFASGLRSILRQDPNVILVGEIRDRETADIALGAAQTGHLLLSTLHTNDATATITRLFDLGIQPFLLAASLLGVVAQRLVRRPCAVCATRQPLAAGIVEALGGAWRLPPDGQWMAGPGCDQCAQSGFKGRIAIHEVLVVSPEVRDLISTRAAEHVLKQAAQRGGMRTLLQDGIDKAAQGLTTIEEVLRVAPRDETAGAVLETARGDMRLDVSTDGTEAPVAGAAIRRVLVVEDSATVVEVLKYFLNLEGFEVLVATDGTAGLEMAFRERPDVIISDVNMPGMGGVAMVKALRGDPRTASARIMMLTSETSVESEAAGLAAGADDYLLKPVEPRRLAARVKALLARSRVA